MNQATQTQPEQLVLDLFDRQYLALQKEAVDLSICERWSIRDIAIKLGVPEKFVKDSLHEFLSGDCNDYFVGE